MATEGRKPSSPLRDALRLFFRNKPAVLAAIAILALAVVAVTGELFTGKKPSPEEIAIIEENQYVGDKVEIKRNPRAFSDPLETVLDEKLLPPFSRGGETGHFYLLGTDHLGRNVVSRLWAGSTISLTIGFLAVGIMALLGISLGGIAGFWGRERIQLPFFAMLLFTLGGAIAYGAEFEGLAVLFVVLAALAFLFQLAIAAIGRRFRALIVFGTALFIFLAINGYNYYIEHTDPNGRAMQQARTIQGLARETLLATRDFGVAVKDIDDNVEGARSQSWRIGRQAEIEILYSRLELEEARYNLIDHESRIELLERTIAERKIRAEHMDRIDRPVRAETERKLLQAEETTLKDLQGKSEAFKEALEIAEKKAAVQESRLALARHESAIAKAEEGGSNTSQLTDDLPKHQWPVLVALRELKLKQAEVAVAARKREITALEEAITELESKPETKPAALEARRAKLTDLRGESLTRLEKAVTEAEAATEKARKSEGGLDNDQTVELGKLTLQKSSELLDRRAIMRQDFLDKYRAEADNRFSKDLIGAKLLSSHWRYPVYRVTRHFITATILWLGLIVSILLVAGNAQGAIQDIKGPLQKIFLPTMTVDDLVMRFTEIMITIPTLFLILAVLALFERDVYIVMAVIGLTGWMGMTRFVRAEILSLREQDFIQAARALGVSDFRIMWRHLVPNAISPVLVAATIGVAGAVLAESTLSFLGIGAAADQPTWGQILNDGRAYMTDAWWLMVIPGFAILITVLSFNLLGEGLREAFNPKLRGR